MVPVIGLRCTIGLEQRALQDFEQALLLDVGVAVMDEYAGLCVSGRVDVEVLTAAGDAAVHILTVILEIHGEELNVALRVTDMTDALDDFHTLLRSRKQVGNRVVADRHIVEEEAEAGALLRQEAEELVAGDGVEVVFGVAD